MRFAHVQMKSKHASHLILDIRILENLTQWGYSIMQVKFLYPTFIKCMVRPYWIQRCSYSEYSLHHHKVMYTFFGSVERPITYIIGIQKVYYK